VVSGVVEQQIPEGYKQTEIGVIPEDWQIAFIGDISDVKTGPFGSALHEKDYVIDGTPIITVEHLGERGVTYDNLPMVSEVDRKRLNTYALKAGDIAFSRVGSIDRNALIRKNEDGWLFSGRLLRVRLSSDRNVPEYLSYHFHSLPFKKRVVEVAVGQTMPSLNTSILKGIKVVLPHSKEEQTAITNALSDVDALITSLEKLITKKRAIKTAAMQQLLTGKKRLPPFDLTHIGYKQTELGEIPEDWELKTVAQSASNIIDYRGVTPRKLGMEWGGGDIVALSAGNVKKGYIDFEAESYFGSEALYKRWMRNGDACKGDIVFTLEAPLGNVALIPDDRKYILSQRTILLQFDKELVFSGYFFQYFLSAEFQSCLSDRATGSTAQGIKRATFELLELPLPSYEEQVSIAGVLSDMDKEIDILEQRLNKAQQLKQGMMQELLTGRTRLI
jgi:type I restriction enzyme S subunit